MASALFLGSKLRARKHRFALCFRVLSNQYVERNAYANVFKFSRENKRFGRAQVNSRCFHWFPVAMLESLRQAPTWRLHTKHYHFQWYLSPNDSSLEYRTSPKLSHIVYLITLLRYFNFLTQFMEWWAILFFTCVIIKLTCVKWKPPIEITDLNALLSFVLSSCLSVRFEAF